MTHERILVVRVGALGDVLHALPAVAALRRHAPGLQVDWVADPRWAPLLADADGRGPEVTRVLLADTRLWSRQPFSRVTLRSILDLRRQVRAGAYDAVIDLQGTLRSAVIGSFAGASRYAGFVDPRERAARWLYRRRFQRRGTHVVQQEANLLGDALGLTLEPTEPQLPRIAEAESWAEERLGSLDAGRLGAGRLALLAPTAGWGAKQWPAERFAALARALAAEGWTVLVNQGSADDPVAERVLAQAGPAGHALQCSVAQLVALMRRCAVVVGGDSGPVHLAAALSVPVVALFGPTDPARNGPWGAGPKRVLRDPASTTTYKRTEVPDPGLARLSVETVMDAVRSITMPPEKL